jgi:hypothetical protein
MEVLRTKNPKTDPNTEICAHLGFSVSICSGHSIDIKMHSHESLGQHFTKTRLALNLDFGRFGTEICAFLGFWPDFSRDV